MSKSVNTWIALVCAALGGVLTWLIWCRDCGEGGGQGSGAPRFRRVKVLNASMRDVPKFKVSRIERPSELWFVEMTTVKDGNSGDWMVLNRALNDPLANSTKVSVEIWVTVDGAMKSLAAVELDTGASNQLLTDLVILVDNHWDTTNNANDFQVTLLGSHSATDEAAQSIKEVQATRTPQ